MLLRSPPSFSLLTLKRDIHCVFLKNSRNSPVLLRSTVQRKNDGAVRFVMNVTKEAHSRTILDMVFEPFEEVKKELLLILTVPQASLARQKFSDHCETTINEQIKDNVALKGLAKFFKESSVEERQHAEKFMEYQVEAIKKISEYVAQLRRVGKGHGVWHFDEMLLDATRAAA